MSYTIKFTDNINKNDLLVNDNTTNTQTSLTFPGRNKNGYGVAIAENFLHLLENFASENLPTNPVEGQLWYKSDTKELLVNDGTGNTIVSWKPTGLIEKGTEFPTPSNTNIGNLFVHTIQKKLYVSTGTFWLLVGPNSTEDAGIMPETIQSSDYEDQLILKVYFGNKVIAIFSFGNSVTGYENQSFVPLKKIDGFDRIYPGLNVSYNTNHKIYGTAEKAEALVTSDGTSIVTSKFLRSDITNTVDQGFAIRNSSGLTLGSNGQVKLQVLDNGVANLHHGTLNSSVYFSVNDGNGGIKNLISLSSDQTAVGINTITPSRTLDVTGTGRFSGILEITDTTDSVSVSTGSLKISGGVAISKKLRVADDVTVDGNINLSKSVSGSVLSPTTGDLLDIGSNLLKFRNIYANNFIGNIDASNITGNIAASTSAKLAVTTKFKIVGDVATIADVNFDGTNTQVSLEAYISSTYITDKLDVTDTTTISSNDDVILIARPQNNSAPILLKTTKKNFAASLSLVPVGTILPYAGHTPPTGYSFCDGSELPQGIYSELFNVIGYTYGPQGTYEGRTNVFRLPDLRGRFALGRNNMDDPIGINGGGDLTPDLLVNRVNDGNATALGYYGGVEQTSIDLYNLPLNTVEIEDTYSGTSVTSGKKTWYNDSRTVTPLSITNPFLTINYIIFHGVME